MLASAANVAPSDGMTIATFGGEFEAAPLSDCAAANTTDKTRSNIPATEVFITIPTRRLPYSNAAAYSKLTLGSLAEKRVRDNAAKCKKDVGRTLNAEMLRSGDAKQMQD